jgi:hypothetical protein
VGSPLLELIVAATILAILTMMALPHRQRQGNWGERGAFQIKADSGGYPPDLDTLVKGIEAQGGKKMRFLRSIPIDPMRKGKEWGLRSMQDAPDSDSWGGQSVV